MQPSTDRHDLKWSGWRASPTQDVIVGWWIARVPPDNYGRTHLVSTTLGTVGRIQPFQAVDLTIQKGHRPIDSWSTMDEMEQAKQSAYDALLEAIRDA